jgi:hypothetical protein
MMTAEPIGRIRRAYLVKEKAIREIVRELKFAFAYRHGCDAKRPKSEMRPCRPGLTAQ